MANDMRRKPAEFRTDDVRKASAAGSGQKDSETGNDSTEQNSEPGFFLWVFFILYLMIGVLVAEAGLNLGGWDLGGQVFAWGVMAIYVVAAVLPFLYLGDLLDKLVARLKRPAVGNAAPRPAAASGPAELVRRATRRKRGKDKSDDNVGWLGWLQFIAFAIGLIVWMFAGEVILSYVGLGLPGTNPNDPANAALHIPRPTSDPADPDAATRIDTLIATCSNGDESRCDQLATDFKLASWIVNRSVDGFRTYCGAGKPEACHQLASLQMMSMGGLQDDQKQVCALFTRACDGGVQQACAYTTGWLARPRQQGGCGK